MKKSIIALSTVLLLSVGVASAQTHKTDNAKAQSEQVQQQEKQVEISTDKLPAAVQKTLETAKFKDWKVTKAYELGAESAKPMYKVELTNGEKKAEYKFDESGAIVG